MVSRKPASRLLKYYISECGLVCDVAGPLLAPQVTADGGGLRLVRNVGGPGLVVFVAPPHPWRYRAERKRKAPR